MRAVIVVSLVLLYLCCEASPFAQLLQYVYKEYKRLSIPLREEPVLANLPILDEYDFIVIGSGPGGASVANRLSEIADWKVLVLEAGKDGSIYTEVPAIVTYLQFTDYNWGYQLESQEGMCEAMKGKRCPWPRGKGIGGSSLLNWMVYTRGRPKDYDRYEQLGNEGWGFRDVLPYFLKSQKINIPEYMDSPWHSSEGYLDVERIPFKSELVDTFLDACKELGLDEIDYNSPEKHEGMSRVQVTMRSGHRVSAAKAYLESVKYRPNLHVAEKARVTRIVVDPATKLAVGVEFVKDRKRRMVFAKKEVILSAGALNSPQLLMLSGIGPREHLVSHGIPVVQDLPVGENLQDHVTTPGVVFLVNSTESITEDEVNPQNLQLWFSEGKGILTLPGGVEGLAYISSKYNTEPDFPDLELLFSSGSLVSDSGRTVKDSFGVTEEFYNSVYRSIDNQPSVTICPIVLRPKSRGRVLLQDKNPWHRPIFYLNYFNDTVDLDVVVDGMKRAVEFAETEAFKRVGARLHAVPYPDCIRFPFGSDKYWECAARMMTTSQYHQAGTCKMGPLSDPTSVVDHRLRVHGVARLRVVDASIFPEVPTAHLYAPTCMVGEKAADMIKADWLQSEADNIITP